MGVAAGPAPARADPRDPRLPQAGHRLQGHHAAAGRSRWRCREAVRALAELRTAAGGRLRGGGRGARLPARPGAGAASSGPASCSRASRASCPMRRSAPSTCSSTAPASWSCTPTRVRGGTRVLVHDDLLATGGTAAALCELVEQLGGEVVGCGFLVELAFLERPRAAGAARDARAAHLRVLGWRTVPTARRSRTIAAPRRGAVGADRRSAPPAALVAARDARGGRRRRRLHRGDAHREGQSRARRLPARARRAQSARRCAGSSSWRARPSRACCSSAETRGEPAAAGRASGDEVTIELRQTLSGFFPRFGGFMVRRAAAATLDEALDGLERISG